MNRPLSCSTLLLTCVGSFAAALSPATVVKTRLLAQESATAKETDLPGTQFLRLRLAEAAPPTSDPEPLSLDTAIVSYQAATSARLSPTPNASSASPSTIVTVDLIAAVHIGEASYYRELNRIFDRYDVLLYELVAPEGTEVPLGGKRDNDGFNPVAILQDSAKNMLGLDSQLELIDYTKSHFVRADMTPKQMADKMAERGETVFSLAFSTLAEAMRQENLAARTGTSTARNALQDIGLADMLGNPLKMKRALAAQFAETGSLDQALGGPLNQLLVVDRNAAALKVLSQQLAAGKRRIGIFYGAAHLADLEKHLLQDFGLQKTEQQWLTAWDLTTAKQPELSQPATLLLNLLKVLE